MCTYGGGGKWTAYNTAKHSTTTTPSVTMHTSIMHFHTPSDMYCTDFRMEMCTPLLCGMTRMRNKKICDPGENGYLFSNGRKQECMQTWYISTPTFIANRVHNEMLCGGVIKEMCAC